MEGYPARVNRVAVCGDPLGFSGQMQLEPYPASYRRRLLATSGLTQQRSGSSVSPAMRLSAAISAIPLRLFTDALAMWGTMTAFGSFISSFVASLASP